jgi:hypothetical protein
MNLQHTLHEFRSVWLPNVTDAGLSRLVGLLESGSPLLIHGAFSKACAMGCLATHIAWHHPETRSVNDEAGVLWLTRVAKLNPATSLVILAWDRAGSGDWELRAGLTRACRDELSNRRASGHTDQSSDAYSVMSGVSSTPSMVACGAD